MHRTFRASLGAVVFLTGVVPPVLHAQPTQPVHIAVRAAVGDRPFACGQAFGNIGTTAASIEASDFKFYVHDVRLVDASGREAAVQLTQDGLWQHGSVALLDFEDGRGACSNGNADLHTTIEGTAPAGSWTGVRFRVGVPFEENHKDLTAQPSPLSLSRMFWAWNSGYKFMRIDLRANGTVPWMIHLGSTECTPTGSATTIPTTCRWPNRPEVRLDGFDPARDAVTFDLAALLREADVTKNQPKTAAGCMSGPTDLDCKPLFVALGLAFPGVEAGAQRVFQVSRGMAAAGGAGGRP